MNTALILRPKDAPRIYVLECDGPRGFAPVNHSPGTFSGVILSFEEWKALPEHLKSTTDSGENRTDYSIAWRIGKLLDATERSGVLMAKHLREMRWRLSLLQPGCLDLD